MAHQAHNIPWQALTAHIKPVFRKYDGADQGESNFYLCYKPQQAKQLTYFVTSFAKNIRNHTRCERKKYPETFLPPARDDLLLTDAVVKKLNPTVMRLRQHHLKGGRDRFTDRLIDQSIWKNSVESLCCHTEDAREFECDCIIPHAERKAAAFLRPYTQNPCYEFFDYNAKAFFNLEILKLLLLYGEMDLILRICANPDIDYTMWHDRGLCYDASSDLGWNRIYEYAIDAYLCFNICYCFPEIWEPASGRTTRQDYRNTWLYQHVLATCTSFGATSEVPVIPHRQFFGVSNDESYDERAHTSVQRGMRGYGMESWKEFLAAEKLEPDPVVESFTINYLCRVLMNKGLPSELVWTILGYVEPTTKNKLQKPLDPFHPVNGNHLRRYLTYCWQLIIRCNMMAQALGMDLNWKAVISKRLAELLSRGDGKWCEYRVGCEDGDQWIFI